MTVLYYNPSVSLEALNTFRRRIDQSFGTYLSDDPIFQFEFQNLIILAENYVSVKQLYSLRLTVTLIAQNTHSDMNFTLIQGSKNHQILFEMTKRIPKTFDTNQVKCLSEKLGRVSSKELMQKINDLNDKLETALYDALISVASLRDNETGNHIKRTALMSENLYQKFCEETKSTLIHKFTPEQLRKATPLHDIGKVGIPDAILLKHGPLTDDEFNTMKTHTVLGSELIKKFRNENTLHDNLILSIAENIAMSHHENFDGSGYPNGIQGAAIPLEARVMAVVDVYDALRSKRPYKEPFSHVEALHEIKKLSHSKFDPALIKVFVQNAEYFDGIFETFR